MRSFLLTALVSGAFSLGLHAMPGGADQSGPDQQEGARAPQLPSYEASNQLVASGQHTSEGEPNSAGFGSAPTDMPPSYGQATNNQHAAEAATNFGETLGRGGFRALGSQIQSGTRDQMVAGAEDPVAAAACRVLGQTLGSMLAGESWKRGAERGAQEALGTSAEPTSPQEVFGALLGGFLRGRSSR